MTVDVAEHEKRCEHEAPLSSGEHFVLSRFFFRCSCTPIFLGARALWTQSFTLWKFIRSVPVPHRGML